MKYSKYARQTMFGQIECAEEADPDAGAVIIWKSESLLCDKCKDRPWNVDKVFSFHTVDDAKKALARVHAQILNSNSSYYKWKGVCTRFEDDSTETKLDIKTYAEAPFSSDHDIFILKEGPLLGKNTSEKGLQA